MSSLDVIAAVLLGVCLPAYGYLVGWPRFLRQLAAHPDTARLREYRITLVLQWVLTLAAGMIFVRGGRTLSQLGLRAPRAGPGLVSSALVAALALAFVRQVLTLRRSETARQRVRAQVATMRGVLPQTAHEMRWFYVLSLTAGICEEFLYRGFFPAVLAPWLTWWGAALLGVVAFGLGHAYQGRSGIIKTAAVGLVFTLVVALTGSLIPAMALHALVDVGSGASVQVALGEG
ncbi:MAG: CPBP family intramembrane glutamic endopeptidase [Gemmatimonadaceae bacterium]